MCGSVQINIAERVRDEDGEYARMIGFLTRARSLLVNRQERFIRIYRHAVKVWMREMVDSGTDDGELQQEMYSRSRRADFTKM